MKQLDRKFNSRNYRTSATPAGGCGSCGSWILDSGEPGAGVPGLRCDPENGEFLRKPVCGMFWLRWWTW